MPRPPDRPDPRAPDTPLRVDEGFEDDDRRRARITVADVIPRKRRFRGGSDYSYPSEPLDLDAVIERIGPERWALLRARRDGLLRQIRGEVDGGGEQ